jgi:hypothetical protein
MNDSANMTRGFTSDANPYSVPSDFTVDKITYKIKKNNRHNSPEVELKVTSTSTTKLLQDLAHDTEKFRIERIAHVMLRYRSENKDRIKAIMLLLDSYESLPVGLATKVINKTNELMSLNNVEDADKVRLAAAIRKLVLKPIKQKESSIYEELNLKRDGQYIIEVDDED